MKMKKTLGSAAVTAMLLMALAGCQEKEGPAEKAGKKIDQAAAELGDRVEKATE
jgi:predicted small lipoprotein YifL